MIQRAYWWGTGRFKGFYKEVWARETAGDKEYIAAFLRNISAWNWGVTDPDFCCSDGKVRNPYKTSRAHCMIIEFCFVGGFVW